MAKTPVSFKLDELDLKRLDSIASELEGGRPDALRFALSAARRELGLYAKDAERFVARLRESMDDDAVIVIELDDMFTPFATVGGVRRDDIYVPTLVVNLGPGEDFLKVHLGDPDSDVRIFVGLLPLRSGVPLSIPVESLRPGMHPRPVAYLGD